MYCIRYTLNIHPVYTYIMTLIIMAQSDAYPGGFRRLKTKPYLLIQIYVSQLYQPKDRINIFTFKR